MATKGIYKLDDGAIYPTNCFPARSLLQPKYEEGAGHWQVARRTAEQTKIDLLFGTKATQVKWRGQEMLSGGPRPVNEKTLDGVQLIQRHHVRSPSHLCSVDISNQNFTSAKEDDFEQFDSVAYINATENLLTLEVFRKFPGLRDLELSLNGLRNLKVNPGDFPHLEILDLSYNNLSPEDIKVLGVLSRIKVLHLTANGLHSLPIDLAVPESGGSCVRFPALEVLLLDDNHLSHPNVFVSLANLRSLKQLNLDKNGIKEVPYLHCTDNARFSIHPLSAKSGIREGLRSRKSTGKLRHQDASAGVSETPDYIILQNSKDPERTEVIFPSPDPPTLENSPSPRTASKMSGASVSQEFTLPLPELRFLSLANNQIEHEEDLLAVALFPSLTELTFHGNPFTLSRSGDPPLLASFLQNRLGIKLIRKTISKLEKPRLFIPVKANRKVKSRLPKVRKRPLMLEAPPTFWQVWTAAELDPGRRASLDGSEPLPPIGSASIDTIFDPLPVVTSFPEVDESESDSLVSSPSEEDMPRIVPSGESSLDHLLFGGVPAAQPSVEKTVFETASLPLRGSLLEGQPRLAAPTGSFSTEQDQPEPLVAVRLPSKGNLSEYDPSAEQDLPESAPQSGWPPAEGDPLEPVTPPNSPLPEEQVPLAGPPAVEVGMSETLPPACSPAEQDQLQPAAQPNLSVQEQNLSEPVPQTGSPPAEEQDLTETLLPSSSSSKDQDLLEVTSPPTGSPTVERDPMEPIAPSQRLDLSEWTLPGQPPAGQRSGILPQISPLTDQELEPPQSSPSKEGGSSGPVSLHLPGSQLLISPSLEEEDELELTPSSHNLPSQLLDFAEFSSSDGSLAEDLPDQSGILPATGLPSAEQDELASVLSPCSLLQEQTLSQPVLPAGSPTGKQDLTGSLPPSAGQDLSEMSPPARPPPEKQDPLGPGPPVVSIFQEPDQAELLTSLPSAPQESPSSPPAEGENLTGTVQLPVSTLTGKASSLELLSSSRSSSRELYQFFAQGSQSAWPSEMLGELSSDAEILSSGESTEGQTPESFFMTQVEEAPGSPPEKETASPKQSSKGKKRNLQHVPKKYRGYELLLDGNIDNDPDFIEPVGIQQNVNALEKALRYPCVYRESKAKLNSLQKPFVPMEKKVLRVPPLQPQQTKVQKLEEVLCKMRTATNILEVPLVCVLRRKKSNWREYREALALLKEFQKAYKFTVAACDVASESRTMTKQQAKEAGPSYSQMLKGLSRVKLSQQKQSQIVDKMQSSVNWAKPSQVPKEDKGL